MSERQFTADDQNHFARLSGDYNKLHMDEIAARRYLFGGPVVHGIHMVLWALDQWLAGSEKSVEIVSLKVLFKKSLRVGMNVECRLLNEENDLAELELYGDEQVYALVSAKHISWGGKPAVAVGSNFPPRTDCRVLSSEDVINASGELQLCVQKDSVRALFPTLVRQLSLTQTAELLAATRLVGMECPGFHSIFSELDVCFDCTKRGRRPILEYRVAHFDKRFSSVMMEICGPSMKGTIKAFLRPTPTQQSSFGDVRKIVPPDEFEDQNALVIGGSRGLGEVTAKLLAAGGARVMLTYVQGHEDAQRVVDEILSAGGRAEIMRFNVLAPEDSLVAESAEFSPTHMYYFATPFITGRRGAFSDKLFKEFCDYYVSGFSRTLEFLLKRAPCLGKVFYPSSVFVEMLPPSLAEYAAAKAAAETLCAFMEKNKKNILIHKPRLPKMATDQTAGIMPDQRHDPVPFMLRHLRDFKSCSR